MLTFIQFATFAGTERPAATLRDQTHVLACLNYLRTNSPAHLNQATAMETYLAGEFRPLLGREVFWTSKEVAVLPPERHIELRELADQVLAAQPSPTAEELRQARTTLKPFLDSLTPLRPRAGGRFKDHPVAIAIGLIFPVIAASLVFVILTSLMVTLLFRRGLLFHLMQIEIVTRDGTHARRWRTFLRATLAWVPLTGLALSLMWVGSELVRHGKVSGAVWAALLFLGVALVGTIDALRHPAQGPAERQTGTWLVPR